MTINRECLDLAAGTAVLMPPGSRVTARQDPEYRMRVFAAHFDGGAHFLPVVARLSDRGFVESLATDAIRAYQRPQLGSQRADTAVRFLLLMLLEAANVPGQREDDPVISDVRLKVDQSPGQAWTLETMASQAGLSRPQFVRRFRKQTGASPARYVIGARTERARLLLRESEMSLSEIADALGYSDVYYFCRQFQSETGCPPGRFRTGKFRSSPPDGD